MSITMPEAVVGMITRVSAALLALASASAAAADAEVEAAFQAVQSAVERRDAAALRRMVHPAFEMLHALGQVETREDWLRLVESGRLPRQTTERREHEIAVQVVGDTAVRGSILRMRDRANDRDMWLRGTATFVRIDGAWVQLRQQSTLLHDGALADAPPADDYIGRYGIPGRDGFAVEAGDGYLSLRWAGGATLPLLPVGGDRFAAGPTSTLAFIRDADGRVSGATRTGPEGVWWTATRTASGPEAGAPGG